MKKLLKIIAISLAAALCILVAGFVLWTRISVYPAYTEATNIYNTAEKQNGFIVFGDTHSDTGLVFYPGGLVEPAAYSTLLKKIADRGVLVILAPMPLDLAFLGIERARKAFSLYPSVKKWALAGHSLGGAMACEYVKKHPDDFSYLILLASFPAVSTSLREYNIKVLSIFGTEDILDRAVFRDSAARLPADMKFLEIAGANHAGFGHYGPQKKDGTALIDKNDQQDITARSIYEFITQK
jgi:hypothetical protein